MFTGISNHCLWSCRIILTSVIPYCDNNLGTVRLIMVKEYILRVDYTIWNVYLESLTNLYAMLLVICKYTSRRQSVVYSDVLWSPQSKVGVLVWFRSQHRRSFDSLLFWHLLRSAGNSCLSIQSLVPWVTNRCHFIQADLWSISCCAPRLP